MDGKQKQDIRNKVALIIENSDKYHFIHATYACQLMIKNIVSEYYEEECKKLSQRIQTESRRGKDISDELYEEYQNFLILAKQGRAHIDIDYINTAEDNARVIKTDNAFVIAISRSLAEQVTNEDGTFNKNVVEKIRKLMAHELGHLMLHTNELLEIEGTQGSKNITDEEMEEEANYFAEKILEKRNERNRLLHSIER